MRMISGYVIMFLLVMCVGCTPYQPLRGEGDNAMGYSEYIDKQGGLWIMYQGSCNSMDSTIYSYAFRRAGEYCKEKGYDTYYFLPGPFNSVVEETKCLPYNYPGGLSGSCGICKYKWTKIHIECAPPKPEPAPAPAPEPKPTPAPEAAPAPAPAPVPAKVVETITLQVYFDTAKWVVKKEYYPEIEKFADYLKRYPDVRAEIEGHTDSVGKPKYNVTLSQKRAKAIMDILVKKYNIDPARLSAKGYGEEKPIAPNTTREGREKNRRVEAVIMR